MNMPKSAKIDHVGILAVISGKTNVSVAQNIQCVKLPKLCPRARNFCGNTSEMNTQITVPCPTACAKIKKKIHAAAKIFHPRTNANAHGKRDAR